MGGFMNKGKLQNKLNEISSNFRSITLDELNYLAAILSQEDFTAYCYASTVSRSIARKHAVILKSVSEIKSIRQMQYNKLFNAITL